MRPILDSRLDLELETPRRRHGGSTPTQTTLYLEPAPIPWTVENVWWRLITTIAMSNDASFNALSRRNFIFHERPDSFKMSKRIWRVRGNLLFKSLDGYALRRIRQDASSLRLNWLNKRQIVRTEKILKGKGKRKESSADSSYRLLRIARPSRSIGLDLPNKIKPILRNNIDHLVRRSWQRLLLKFRSTDLYARQDHWDYPRNKSPILGQKKKWNDATF